MQDILDPTIQTPRERIDYAPRPAAPAGLRIGLVENSKKNAEAVLRELAARLEAAHGMRIEVLVHKPQRAPLAAAQIDALRGKVDFAIAGVGD